MIREKIQILKKLKQTDRLEFCLILKESKIIYINKRSQNESEDTSFSTLIQINKSCERRGSALLQSISSNPSSAINLATIIGKIDTTDFNIFDLNDLIERKTVFIMANEIFNRYQFLDLMDEDKFKEFVTQIILGYNRDVAYHNV